MKAEQSCHYCEEKVEETYECHGCGQQTCEDCFSPMSPMATDPVTPCLECSSRYEREFCAENDREARLASAKKEWRDKANEAARRRYHLPENVEKRRLERERKLIDGLERSARINREVANVIRGFFR